MSKYLPRITIGFVSLNAVLLSYQYYLSQPLSPRQPPTGIPSKVERQDPLRRFRDPKLSDFQTTPDDLIIPDGRAGKRPLHKASSSPGKGIGLFATEFIPKGASIFQEKTVLTCPTQGRLDARDLQIIFDQVANLSPQLQDGILGLSGKVPVLNPKSPLMVYYRALLRQDVFHPDGSRLSWRESSKLQKVLRIFYTNAAAVYEGTSTRWFWRQRSVGDGLFLTFSRMNHSCEPNADWDTYYEPGVMMVWAKKDIQADEEIAISYIGQLDEPVEARRKRLAQWGFICQCSKCGPPPGTGKSQRQSKSFESSDSS